MKCAKCKEPATKKVLWADGRAYQPSCDAHVEDVKKMLTAKNGKMTELAGVQDLSDVVDLVSSRVYPDLERKPGGPDNWVEAAGGLPSYIERIAKHLHYERGYSISRAIATAVNTVKRWARGGHVTKYGTTKTVTPITQAKALAAVASWEAKKRAGSMALSEELLNVIDLTEVSEEFAFDMLGMIPIITGRGGFGGEQAGADATAYATLSTSDIDLAKGDMDIRALAERANKIEDPTARATARRQVLDLASTIAPRNARGKATDGRNSFKGQGKWKHGFIPANKAAHEAKAKGSPIAMKRTRRLFGKGTAPDDATKSSRENTAKNPNRREFIKAATGRAGSRHVEGTATKRNPKDIRVDEKSTPGSEGVKDIGQLRRTGSLDAESNRPARSKSSSQKEASKSSRIPERATQNWDEIPETAKTVRNGKRYVLAEFGGKQYVTEWVGGVDTVSDTALKDRKVMRTLSSADAANMSQSELRALVNNPRTPDSVVKAARKALRVHAASEAK